jgi:hypothetical protein
MTPKQLEAAKLRVSGFVKDGVPRKVRIYDNGGETADRYTVVFTGRYRDKTMGEFWSLGMSGAPFHPQGVGMHSTHPRQIDYPTYGHLGKKISFVDLPEDCQRLVFSDYRYLWDLPLMFERVYKCLVCNKPIDRTPTMGYDRHEHQTKRLYVKADFSEVIATKIRKNEGRLPEEFCP